MGHVRTKTIKRAARLIVEKYYSRLGTDFHMNKAICEEVAVIPSKRMRNKIAGFVTHIMVRIEDGEQVRGVSLKLQEEERERRDNYVPKQSVLDVEKLEIDPVASKMLESIGFGDMEKIEIVEPTTRRERRQRY
ncbi:Ribosomal protein S17e [Carpediemonas membranifera]|uniref:Ribosomal protein S17e n=1 Tax=Carpediemonas membranifera TaxID=201153 RepID=A0A8J6EB90_9EUKA|nr:Ribosomal protein S17e [Carpediemonas membranifera]|eukprot:KAG9396580.1 Ribosomal protein S17e [Carpediemonas membranifera]